MISQNCNNKEGCTLLLTPGYSQCLSACCPTAITTCWWLDKSFKKINNCQWLNTVILMKVHGSYGTNYTCTMLHMSPFVLLGIIFSIRLHHRHQKLGNGGINPHQFDTGKYRRWPAPHQENHYTWFRCWSLPRNNKHAAFCSTSYFIQYDIFCIGCLLTDDILTRFLRVCCCKKKQQ